MSDANCALIDDEFSTIYTTNSASEINSKEYQIMQVLLMLLNLHWHYIFIIDIN
jgi:hypothetical protein